MRIGTDLCHLARLKNPQRLAQRILTSSEYALFQKSKQPTQFLAGRFAAKEAFFKAFPNAEKPSFTEIEILPDAQGAPVLTFAQKRYPVSIAHDGDYAVATVLIE